MVTYRRPQTLSQSLTKYRKIAHNVEEECAQSRPCGRCSLCGNFGKYTTNMVNTTRTIKAKSGKTYTLRKSLTCADAGIYVAACRTCGEHYVGQTITSFSTRWNTHRKLWNEGATNDGDRTALLTHYNTVHGGSGAQLAEAFSVTFVEKALNPTGVDSSESNWINRLEATININKTALPRYR